MGKLFTVALNANFLSDSMMKRMQNHRDTYKKPPTTPPPHVPSAKRKSESLSYKERVSKIQNIGGLASGAMSLQQKNCVTSPTKMKNGKPYSVRITKPENGAKPTLNDLLGIHSPTRTSTKDSLSPTAEDEDDNEEHAKTNSKSVRFDDGNGNGKEEKEEDDDDDEFDDENWDAINEDIANVLAENFNSQKNLIKNQEEEEEQSESMNINHNEESKSVDDQAIEAQISPQLKVLSGSFVEKKSEDIYGDDDDVDHDLHVDMDLMNGDNESSDDEKDVIGEQSGDQMYEFAYGFLRDVVYHQMLHNQRKQLHTNALKYIATCLKDKMDDKLALLHTRHIECIQKYSDMLQGEDTSRSAHQPKRQSFFGKYSKK